MKCIKSVLVCVFAVVVPMTHAFAQSWLCENENLDRYVDIHYPNSPSHTPCSVIYRKPTENVVDRILWQAQNEEGYCETKAKAFIEKMESWGWRCSVNATNLESKSMNSKSSSRSLSAATLEKHLYNAIKLDEVDDATSVRFDQYLDVLRDYKKSNYISDQPDGYINEFQSYYLLNEQAYFLGHKVIILTEPTVGEEKTDCCPDRKFMIYLETVGRTDPLKEFTEVNDCYFKDKYIWSFGGMHFNAGQFAVLDC